MWVPLSLSSLIYALLIFVLSFAYMLSFQKKNKNKKQIPFPIMETLPTELIRQIIEVPHPHPTKKTPLLEQQDLSRLARTSRLLHNIVNTFVYTSIEIDGQRLRPFLRTIINNPILAARVEDVKYCWEEYDLSDDDTKPSSELIALFEKGLQKVSTEHVATISEHVMQGSAAAEAILLLLLLPELKNLNLSFEIHDYDREYELDLPEGIFRMPFFVNFLKNNTFPGSLPSLQSLYIASPFEAPWTIKASYPPCRYWDLEELNGIFLFKNLRKIHLDRCCSPLGIPDISSLYGCLPLEDITILHSSVLLYDVTKILKLSKGIKRLKYYVSSPDQLEDFDTLYADYTDIRVILNELTAHRKSLEYIELFSKGREGTWKNTRYDTEDGEFERPGVDVHPFSFRDFPVLKDAHLQAIDLIGPVKRPRPAIEQTLKDALPPSLESLNLYYADKSDDEESQLPDEWYQAYYNHLLDFVSLPETEFPHLRNITVCVLDHWPPLPEEISKAADLRRFEFNVLIRSVWDDPEGADETDDE